MSNNFSSITIQLLFYFLFWKFDCKNFLFLLLFSLNINKNLNISKPAFVHGAMINIYIVKTVFPINRYFINNGIKTQEPNHFQNKSISMQQCVLNHLSAVILRIISPSSKISSKCNILSSFHQLIHSFIAKA